MDSYKATNCLDYYYFRMVLLLLKSRESSSKLCKLYMSHLLQLQKQYAAVVWLSRPVTESDYQSLSDNKELVKNSTLCLLHSKRGSVCYRRDF
jgi:hypothetical protein